MKDYRHMHNRVSFGANQQSQICNCTLLCKQSSTHTHLKVGQSGIHIGDTPFAPYKEQGCGVSPHFRSFLVSILLGTEPNSPAMNCKAFGL